MSQPPAVEYGLIEPEDWEHLISADDEATYARRAAALCYNDPLLFGHIFLGYDLAEHLVEAWNELDEHQKNLILMCRGSGKSTLLAEVVPTHHICYSTVEGSEYEDTSILLLGESHTAITSWLKEIKDNLKDGGKNSLIHKAFGDIFFPQSTKWSEDIIDFDFNGASDYAVRAAGSEAAVTGMHPDLIVADDLVSSDNSRTKVQRDKLSTWWNETVMGMADPTTEIYVVGTRYRSGDLYEELQEANFNTHKQEALPRMPQEGDYELTEEGELIIKEQAFDDLESIWPCPLGPEECPGTDKQHFEEHGRHLPLPFLLEKYDNDPISFASQYQNHVIESENSRITEDMLRFYSMDSRRHGEEHKWNESRIESFPHPDQIVQAVHAWDHAIGTGKQHDNTAVARCYRTQDNDLYVIVEAGKWSYDETVNKMEGYYKTDPYQKPDAVVTEAVNFQKIFGDSLLKESDTMIPVEQVKKNSDKDEFLVNSGMLQMMKNGQIYTDIEDEETVMELLNFSGDSGDIHDDRVDALSMAVNWLTEEGVRKAQHFRIDNKRRGGMDRL